MLKSLDLFSGIGGITLALQGIAKPIGYCDWAPESRQVIERLQARKLLPKAPVYDDVRTLSGADMLPARPDMIVGGFPCVGFSPVGLRKAFDDAESGLFSEILRLADETGRPALFLENVPNVLKLGMTHVLTELVDKRGYEVRWTVVSAHSLGAPHKRARWFMLAIRPEFNGRLPARTSARAAAEYRPYAWDATPEPVRARVVQFPNDRHRKAMLGNSVVPDAVRSAFLYLASGGRPVEKLTSSVKIKGAETPSSSATSSSSSWRSRVGRAESWPATGVVHADGSFSGAIEKAHPLSLSSLSSSSSSFPKKMELVFHPSHFRTDKPPSKSLKDEHLIEDEHVHADKWSTPRHGNTEPSNYMTRRSIRDLPTQVRFEKNTPKPLRKGSVTPEFLEYLMGYPIGWTEFGGVAPKAPTEGLRPWTPQSQRL